MFQKWVKNQERKKILLNSINHLQGIKTTFAAFYEIQALSKKIRIKAEKHGHQRCQNFSEIISKIRLKTLSETVEK